MLNKYRDGLGRIMGSRFEFNNFEEEEFWEDKKIREVRFPNHDNKHGEVITYYLSKEDLDTYLNKLYKRK